ncbi:MAG TPA: MBL fold metallo-hydrolase [Actinomycetota bacterium]
MRVRVLGGCGAWPAAGQACSGYLVELDGFRLLVDPGYATFPRLLELVPAERVDAVLVSHGHPDHCADLHPLLRARTLRDEPAPPLPVHTMPNALGRVLALDRPGLLDDAYRLVEFAPGDGFGIGPFDVRTFPLPHSLPNAGLRLVAGGRTLAYTGDTGPSPELPELARNADVFLAEASFADEVPAASASTLSSAGQMAQTAGHAGVAHLILTHLLPGTDPARSEDVARAIFDGEVTVARAGTALDLDDRR